MLHIGTRQPYKSVDEAKQFLDWAVAYQTENNFCRLAVVENQSGKIIGNCGFARLKREDVELGYLFAREVWGNSFAVEAARACLGYGFQTLGFTEIIAPTDVDHFASQKVLEKIGFRRRGIEKYEDDEDMVFEIEKASTAKNA
jgi:RimJ/RimL family protein N-acetyltransferase